MSKTYGADLCTLLYLVSRRQSLKCHKEVIELVRLAQTLHIEGKVAIQIGML